MAGTASTSCTALPPSLPRTLELRARNSSRSLSSAHFVIGVDEAGRGPLAGPVVAAAFVILQTDSAAHPPSLENGIADSKTVGESDREMLFGCIGQCAQRKQIAFETAIVEHSRIDEINILQATFEAMSAAALAIVKRVQCSHSKHATFSILIDGNKVPLFSNNCTMLIIPHAIQQIPPALASTPHLCTSVIKGDGIEFVIAAASICAKVTRDRIMRNIHEKYPLYNFEQHKGYGTAAHVAAIFRHGPCPYHRMTFAPLKNMNVRPTVKATAKGKAASSQPSPTFVSKRARSQSTPTTVTTPINSRGCTTAAAAPCMAESERTSRLRRRTERKL
jgi:ribonuclease HII